MIPLNYHYKGSSSGKHNSKFGGVQNNFRAAVVKVDITPKTPQRLRGYGERTSTGVHDQIYHRIVVLDDGATQFVLVSTEACAISPVQYDHIASKLTDLTGIKPENFWWTLTHTHSAPHVGDPGFSRVFMPNRHKQNLDTNYCALIEKKLIDGILDARRKLAPARLSTGWGFSQANINRRAIDVDGKASLGLNPDGAVDRRIGLIRIDREDGTPLVLIANYPIHGTVLGSENLEISGDAPGIVSEYVEQKIGAPLLFINGAAGNLAPIYSGYPNPKAGRLSQFRVLLGDKILDAYQNISSSTRNVTIKTESLIVKTARKPKLEWPADFDKYTRTSDTGLELVLLPVYFLRINDDIAIWSAPIELFCEISNEIRNKSPFPYTFYFGFTNGWFGYLPTEAEWKKEGYEPSVSVFTPIAEKDLTNAVLSHLMGVARTQPPGNSFHKMAR